MAPHNAQPPADHHSAGQDAPRVAVVVPSYNHAPYLERCLRSIFAQTLPPAELVVIDDGSRDDSPAVAARVLADCPFPAELIVRPNRGLCATLNEGLARTRGELFAYLGSDDYWHPDRLRAAVAALAAAPDAVLACGRCYVVDARDRIIGCSPYRAEQAGRRALRSLLAHEFVPPSPTVTYRRAALERERWDERCRLEDYDLYLRLARLGPFAFIERPLAYWRWHAGNTSRATAQMLAEVLAAQARFAAASGLSPRALRRYQDRARFRFATHFLLAGDRARAWYYGVRYLGGAPSAAAVAGLFARLLLPGDVLAALRRWRHGAYARASAPR